MAERLVAGLGTVRIKATVRDAPLEGRKGRKCPR
jgi:hypothetical protein